MPETNPNAKPYELVSQRETVARLPDDSFGQVVRITFRVTGGPVLSVDVPMADYTADNARRLIMEKVGHAQEIQNL